jgi:uncharacterized protein (DUF1800 family)
MPLYLFLLFFSIVLGQSDPPVTPLNDHEIAVHLLNRMAFGGTPGQVEEILEKGWKNWIEEQLYPQKINESEFDKKMEEMAPSLQMTMGKIFEKYRPSLKKLGGITEEERREHELLKRKIRFELKNVVLLRAVYSRKQFQEVMVEFWRNHFNVDQNKDDVEYLASHYEVNVLRKHVFGKFEEMLMASAKHPAMLIYLDNILSRQPLSKSEEKTLKRHEAKGKSTVFTELLKHQRGLNENYARELMELHTLGVDNYYRQKDVIELARILTGWSAGGSESLDREFKEYDFQFRDNLHDTRSKIFLGKTYSEREGLKEGELAILTLARHPGTAQFIAWKLCKYLVQDQPSDKLVRDIAKIFHKTQGDLRETYRAILFHPEFLARPNFKCKFKTPLEFTVSVLRATEAKISQTEPTLRALKLMGQAIYECDDPTGYYDQAEAWLDPGVLLHRWEYAQRLIRGHIPGVEIPQNFYATLQQSDAKEKTPHLISLLLSGIIDEETQYALKAEKGNWTQQAGFLLGSPAFQQQ